MKKVFVVCLGLLLTFSIAHAAPASSALFFDVPTGSWFEQGITTCVEKGVMIGIGEGLFSPNRKLTNAECLILSLRLYDFQRGGSGTLMKAPQGWGTITLTLSDGTTFQQNNDRSGFTFGYHHFMIRLKPDQYKLYAPTPGNSSEDQWAWAVAHEGPAELNVDGTHYGGTVEAHSVEGKPCLVFLFDEHGKDEELKLYNRVYASLPSPDAWYADAVYTAWQWKLNTCDGFDALSGECSWSLTPRDIFARALSVAVGELETKYTVSRIPDLKRTEHTEGIYRLYEAGILSGTDDYGTFWSDKELTRAEAAVIVARILEPAQRLTSPPSTPGAYETAVAELRTQHTYNTASEQTIETDYCTIFLYGRVGVMHAPDEVITLIYKSDCAVPEGTTIHLPFVQNGPNTLPADTKDLSADGKTFTYSYTFETISTGGEPGTYTYTVDLPTGKVTSSYIPL